LSSETTEKLSREALLERALKAIYESSTMAVFFHNAIAERFGLGATEEKTLLILSSVDSLTAGEIAEATGLTSASATSLIDRLERKGFVQRIRDTHDRRRVIVQPNRTRLAEISDVFASLQGAFEGLFDPYDEHQLATIVDFLIRSAQQSREAIEKLNRAAQDAGEQTPG